MLPILPLRHWTTSRYDTWYGFSNHEEGGFDATLGCHDFLEECSPCMVRVARDEPSKGKAINVIQLKEGSKKETTYLAVLEMEEFEGKNLSSETKGVANECLDESLPRREVDPATKLDMSKKKHVVGLR